jgi:phage-related protein
MVLKPVYWIGSSKADLLKFPEEVRLEAGYAIYVAQKGNKHSSVKPLKGYKGAGVLEISGDHNKNTYRVVYAVTFKENVYVLHAFQKKSKQGIATPKKEMDLIDARFKAAQEHYKRKNQ